MVRPWAQGIFGQKSKVWPINNVLVNIETLVKNGFFLIEIMLRNRNFRQQSKLRPKIKFLGENQNFRLKIEILIKNLNFGQKSKVRPKIDIWVRNQNFGQKSKFWTKILSKNPNFEQKSWARIQILTKNLILFFYFILLK